MTKSIKIGLSLSGGGYRASAFHLGTLNKLNELGILKEIDVISTISGGSITGAAWCLHEGNYDAFHNELSAKLKTKSIIRYILTSIQFIVFALFVLLFIIGSLWLTFTQWAHYSFLALGVFIFIVWKWQFLIFPISEVIERAYNIFFYGGKKLRDLKDKPVLAIGSSNLETGRVFTFSKLKMSDSSYSFKNEYNPSIYFKQENFPVARAVMASSCVPFAFTPVTINKEFFLNEADFKRIHPKLVDGGVYDNQGIHKITQPHSSYECSIIITSDAGGSFLANKQYPNTFKLLLRTVDLFMNRIKTFQMVQHIYQNIEGAAKPIAYLSLGWEIKNLIPGFVTNMIQGKILNEVIKAHTFKAEWVEKPENFSSEIKAHLENKLDYASIERRKLSSSQLEIARNTKTSLKCLSKEQLDYLITHAENLTELQVKLYCPMLIQ